MRLLSSAAGVAFLCAIQACRSVEKPVTAARSETAPLVANITNIEREVAEPESKENGATTGRVVTVYMNETGETFLDGEAITPEELRDRLAALRAEDAVAWCAGTPETGLNAQQQSLFEHVMKLGLKTVWVSLDGADGTARDSGGKPITVNTKYVREALNLYDRLKGGDGDSRKLLPADVVLRFEPTVQGGYVVRRVELGVVGQSLWVVHEALSDAESATSIQLKKEW